jgi:purine-binding chemotaxis protein CheW
MDIAEIRKKAKGSAGNRAAKQPPAPAPEAVQELVVGSPVEGIALEFSLPAGSSGAVDSASGLDRLFARAGGMQFATEEAYQTSLASQDTRDDANFTQFLAFQLGSEEYALDISRISEIIKPREYTDIPRVPEFVLGLISLRGVVVPVIDLRLRFKLGSASISPSSRVVVCREGEMVAGLLVDSIKQVIKLSADKIEPPPAVLSGVDRSLLEGVGRYQGRMIILLDLVSVLDVAMA